jgi:nitrogen fixation/metabolism regulation signal transduction histidine kinase
MARTLRWLSGLRGRLLSAFTFVAIPPLLILALSVNVLVSRSFEKTAEQRLVEALGAAQRELEKKRERAREQVTLVATVDLPASSESAHALPRLASAIAPRRDLAVLEIVDVEGRVISSHHWPAGFGLLDRDALFPGDESLRVEKVASGYGAKDVLTLTATHEGHLAGAPVWVRGGALLDASLAEDLTRLLGTQTGIHDRLHGSWIVPAGSPLGSAPAGFSPGNRGGDLVVSGTSYRWAAAPLHPELWLVVATPRTAVETVKGSVRTLSLVMAGVALLAALVAAVAVSGHVARPVRELADGARQVASGDWDVSVGVAGADEIGDLARAFGVMTEELRTSRERLLQAERVAAWREMARRLAHELKNPLFPIQLSIETLRRTLEQATSPDPRDFQDLFMESSDTILEELASLRKIIDEFSQFARMPQPEPRPTDLNAVAQRAVELYRPRAEGVAFDVSLAPGLPLIPADADLLGRALGNLLSNALDAMPQGGTLSVRTAESPGAVTVEVEDTGPGLTEDQRTRLFTPYFTTKKDGTGLGLAIVQGIVSDHGGRVQVQSEAGSGTRFTLILPVRT